MALTAGQENDMMRRFVTEALENGPCKWTKPQLRSLFDLVDTWWLANRQTYAGTLPGSLSNNQKLLTMLCYLKGIYNG